MRWDGNDSNMFSTEGLHLFHFHDESAVIDGFDIGGKLENRHFSDDGYVQHAIITGRLVLLPEIRGLRVQSVLISKELFLNIKE